ncbi:MAG: hypothetical protein M2R45_02417 [Verrucomicrobia subdivision 3 bacterium]|nr:hypothetical protein [Limisphaerales bacterium]MCS1416377.1 hypothetical protein [Limisphaerales bacterium]
METLLLVTSLESDYEASTPGTMPGSFRLLGNHVGSFSQYNFGSLSGLADSYTIYQLDMIDT